MKLPKMIMFDYGQTLVDFKSFEPLKGTRAVLNQASYNPENISAEEVQALANELGKDIGRVRQDSGKESLLEIHNFAFQNYLYEYFGIEINKSSKEVEKIFQDDAFIGEKTTNIEEFLEFLDSMNIRTAVISNITFSGDSLKERINSYIPSNKFEFIIASSEYVFRKPHKRIFEMALRKAKLNPADVWYCGDNAVNDVDGASFCGIFPVWYKGALESWNKNIPESNCLEINDWKELIKILNENSKVK